jgi:HEAT repeat protein
MPHTSILARALAAAGVFAALVATAGGCSKRQPPAPAPDAGDSQPAPPEDRTARDRAIWLKGLKSANQKTRQEAVDQLAIWVETDADTVAALVELLKDKSNAGAGKTHPTQINSIREAAARALLDAGPKGEVALKDKGLAALKEGLLDPDAAVREHTAHAVGLLGPIARPLSGELVKLCTAPEEPVRGAAFDALRAVGVTDAAAFAKLLTNEDAKVARLAAELVPSLENVPEAAVASLAAALAGETETIRVAAATGLATAGPKAAPAVEALVAAIKKTEAYQGKYDPETTYSPGGETAYWRALVAIGEPAVAPTAALLAHENALVRGYAAQALGDIGAPAKAAAEKLKGALKDDFGFVAVEAACALVRAGEAKDEAVALVRRAIQANNSVAMTAIDAIPRMGEGGKALVEDALAKLKFRADKANPYAQYAAVGLVGTLPPAEATKYAADLGDLATNKEPLIRQRVGFVLEKLGPAAAPAAAALGAAIPAETNSGIRDQFIDALVATGPGAKPALPTLLKLVADPASGASQRQRLVAAVVVADPASKEVADALLAAAGDADDEIRVAAAAAVAKLDPVPKEALAKLAALAKGDRGTRVRFAAYRSLATLGPRAAPVKAEVEELAKGKYPEYVLLAKVAVASIEGNPARAAADVRAALADRNPQVRAVAVGSLVLVGPTVADLPALAKLLKDRGPSARESAVRCVGKLGPAAKETVPQLVKMLGDTEPLVRLAAIEVLGDFGPAAQPAVEKLKELRGTPELSDPQIAPAARKALEKLGVGEKK